MVGEQARLRTSWQSPEIPQRQRFLVDSQLSAHKRGVATPVFDVLVKALRALSVPAGSSVLEIGCSSGYYSEVLASADLGLVYSGCDYSPAFIEMAEEKYPDIAFDVQDATELRYADRSFDIVISGCCLLHIPEYSVAIAETARVTGQYAIFHRTPVVIGRSTEYFRKKAYGVETVEIHFNEEEFIGLLTQSGLRLVATYTLDESIPEGSACRTYVCRKVLM
ncbi:MAG: methyltransferase domain-containing protein [Rhodocyclaceae bacterium]|nr:methyltransferase domain-containing protein [Rhodocyclaceae bacterium]